MLKSRINCETWKRPSAPAFRRLPGCRPGYRAPGLIHIMENEVLAPLSLRRTRHPITVVDRAGTITSMVVRQGLPRFPLGMRWRKDRYWSRHVPIIVTARRKSMPIWSMDAEPVARTSRSMKRHFPCPQGTVQGQCAQAQGRYEGGQMVPSPPASGSGQGEWIMPRRAKAAGRLFSHFTCLPAS